MCDELLTVMDGCEGGMLQYEKIESWGHCIEEYFPSLTF